MPHSVPTLYNGVRVFRTFSLTLAAFALTSEPSDKPVMFMIIAEQYK